MAKNGKSNGQITAEEFIRIWQESANMDEVQRQIPHIKRAALHGRASNYRKYGVPLRKFDRGQQPHDYPALAKLAKSLAPKE